MPYSPYYQPAPGPQPQPSSGKDDTLRSLIALVLVFLLLFIASYGWLQFQDGERRVRPDNDTVVIDDTTPEPQPQPDEDRVPLSDTYVVRVYETEADRQKAWMVQLLDDDSFWIDWFEQYGMEYFTIAAVNNPEQAESFLAAARMRDIEPPFYIHAKAGGKVLSIHPFKEGMTTDDVKQTLLEKAK
jgi:hypothetical protein